MFGMVSVHSFACSVFVVCIVCMLVLELYRHLRMCMILTRDFARRFTRALAIKRHCWRQKGKNVLRNIFVSAFTSADEMLCILS